MILTLIAIVAGMLVKSVAPWGFFMLPYFQNKYCDYPTHIQCWTEWFDRDNPSGTGDYETLLNLRMENKGKICHKPLQIEVTTLAGASYTTTGDVIAARDTTIGFVCKTSDQPGNVPCQDYRVRFSCHPPFCGGGVCWTQWFDRDDPSGTGDWENLSLLKEENPGVICDTPLYIESVTVDGLHPAHTTGQTFYLYSPTDGFTCRNEDNTYCLDYKVRFGCPCDC